MSYLTFGNLTPMIASSGFDRKQFVISFVTSLFNRLFPFVSKWHAICWDTSTRILSGSGIIDHGLNAEPLSNIARWIKAENGFYNSFLFLFLQSNWSKSNYFLFQIFYSMGNVTKTNPVVLTYDTFTYLYDTEYELNFIVTWTWNIFCWIYIDRKQFWISI